MLEPLVIALLQIHCRPVREEAMHIAKPQQTLQIIFFLFLHIFRLKTDPPTAADGSISEKFNSLN
ncbi:hypothetical protein WH188_13820 [Sphingobacterium sp. MYb388]